MALTTHVCGPARIADATALIIDQVEGQALNLGTRKITRNSAGQYFPTFSGIQGQAPRFSLTTSQVGAVLGKITTKGLILATGFEIYNQLVDTATALRKSGSTHQKVAIATGLVIPRTLSCSSGGEARLTFDVVGVNAAGTTCPVALTESQALPTVSGISALFTLGPVKINGTQLEGNSDVSIDFGIRERLIQLDGVPYPQAVVIDSIMPKVTIKNKNASALATLGLAGTAQGATDSVIYFRKMLANGIRTADGTAEHLSFTIDDGIWSAIDKSANHPNEAETGVEIEPVYDGTNEPLVFSAAAAIA